MNQGMFIREELVGSRIDEIETDPARPGFYLITITFGNLSARTFSVEKNSIFDADGNRFLDDTH